MQIFFPLNTAEASVRCLDNKRLVNQILRECKTLINGGWSNHPVSKLWAGYEIGLCCYALDGIQELRHRGLASDTIDDHESWWSGRLAYYCSQPGAKVGIPDLVYEPEFQLAHRSNLLAKDFEWYSRMPEFAGVVQGMPYIWNDADLMAARREELTTS